MSVPVKDIQKPPCGKYFIALSKRASGVARYMAFPLRCHSWDCPRCRAKKASDYRDRMLRVEAAEQLYMITLTYYHDITPDQAWMTYNAAWNRLRTALKKKFGPFNYVRVLESHKESPYPHLHVICDKSFEPRVFGPLAVGAGFGYQLKISPITGDGAIGYVTKYLTKEWKNVESWELRRKYHCRLISFSSGLLSPARQSAGWRRLFIGTDLQSCVNCINGAREFCGEMDCTTSWDVAEEEFYEITVVFNSGCPEFDWNGGIDPASGPKKWP